MALAVVAVLATIAASIFSRTPPAGALLPAADGSSTTANSTTASPTTANSTTTNSSTSTVAPPTTAPSPPPVDLATIHADQRTVIRLRFQPILGPAQTALTAAQASLAQAQNQLQDDQQASINAATSATLATLALKRDITTKQQLDGVNARAQATLARDHHALVTIAVQLYVGDPTAGPATTAAQLEQKGIATQLAQGAISHIAATVATDQRAAAAAEGAVTQAGTAVRNDEATVAEAHRSAQRAAGAIAPDTALVSSTAARLHSASATLQTATAQVTRALSAFASAPDGPISILGSPALDTAQLVTWFDTSGFVDLTSTPIDQLAGWYLSEGAREGVRGDVAFAQSVVETGGFESPDAVTRNNYAGIAHCDSCAAGEAFPSAQLGVRAQMQLLRTYATPGLTTAELTDRPATAAVSPEGEFRRGCCSTWQALTGTWATSPIYGPTILNVYQEILDYTVSVGSASRD